MEDKLRQLTDEVCLLVEIFDELPIEFRPIVLDAWMGVAKVLVRRVVLRRLARRSITRDAIDEVVNRCVVGRDVLAFEQLFE
ncbi:hypothetical protein ASD81_24415 [Nocardioides sp. Root614]|nr:hypothetical protein ASD81_24415 [Nocardioides sp. Root614]KRA91113.1 hypothetical protein ASD84_00115 [Nocardioides sp. Root682]